MRQVLKLAIASAVMIAGTGVWVAVQGADDAKPKYTIKEVMAKAHKNKLMNRLAEGKGTKEEAKELVELYTALGANKPTKGDAEGWKAKTVALLEAAQGVADGKEGAGDKLKAAANCANCHKEHKGS